MRFATTIALASALRALSFLLVCCVLARVAVMLRLLLRLMVMCCVCVVC